MKLNQRSFGKLYDKLAPRIYRFVFFKVRSAEIAQDLTHDTFLKGWQYCQKNEVKFPQAIFYQVARQQIADFWRRQKFQVVSLDAKPFEMVDEQPGLDERLAKDDELNQMFAVLATLPEDQQEILTWRYLDGYSYRQISKILNKPSGTIRVTAHRALKQLKEKWQEGTIHSEKA